MADANEDLLHTASPAQPPSNPDSDDETGDMAPNFLNLTLNIPTQPLSHTSLQPSGALPKRGVKDFEANPTLLQSRTLAASRQAMHDALSHTRVHNPHAAGLKAATVAGTYDADSGETFVTSRRARGKMFATVGAAKRVCLPGGIVREGFVLLPEESLWALESGRLDVRYPVVEGQDTCEEAVRQKQRDGPREETEGEEQEEEEQQQEALGMPMSLQGAYAAFIGEEALRDGKLTSERYLVYAALKRAGYTVLRAETWDGKTSKPSPGEVETEAVELNSPPSAPVAGKTPSLWNWLYSLIFQHEHNDCQLIGPLVPPGIYRNYNDIYRRLHLITRHSSQDSSGREASEADSCSFTTTFNVYKPSATYRKSAPGPPDFRICVISARDNGVPTLTQLSCLIEEQPLQRPDQNAKPHRDKSDKSKPKDKAKAKAKADEKPKANGEAKDQSPLVEKNEQQPPQAPDPRFTPNSGSVGHMYSRLKRGRKNVIIAVVDEGLVSYVRLSDSCFGLEKVYERHSGSQQGGAGSGKGGGGGRGGKNRGKGRRGSGR